MALFQIKNDEKWRLRIWVYYINNSFHFHYPRDSISDPKFMYFLDFLLNSFPLTNWITVLVLFICYRYNTCLIHIYNILFSLTWWWTNQRCAWSSGWSTMIIWFTNACRLRRRACKSARRTIPIRTWVCIARI